MDGVMYSSSTQAYKVDIGIAKDETVAEEEILSRSHGRELTDHEGAADMLQRFSEDLWARGPSDIGRCTKMDPVILEVVPGSRVYVPQRSFRTDKQREGIETALTDLWEAGVLELSDSHWNTPLNPVPKPDGTFRPAHDLRKVNEVTTTPLLPVPDPHKCLSVLTPEMKYFTVIDLKHAFFTIPLAEECRYQFAFTYGGVKLQYKVLPQGHRNSPGIFNKVLKDCLSPIEVLSGAVVVQYVDDVLIGARSAKDCLDVTAAVLSRL
uniref:ribonuclease H n=1 Tax=Neogobius melanostomus TaxID=47308 RepID=A0A8C6SCH9_9GOBI